MKVLILEDNSTYIDVISRMLKDGGFEVCKAKTVEEAKETFRKEKPDAAILDIELDSTPEGKIAGFTFAEHLLNTRSIPFIFLTQHFDVPYVNEHMKRLGIDLSALFPKKHIENSEAFIASILSAFERFQELMLTPNIYHRIGFFVRKKDNSDHHQFFAFDEIFYFKGDGLGGVEIYTSIEEAPFTYARNLNELIPRVSKVWPQFIRLGASYLVNSSKIRKLVRLKKVNTLTVDGTKEIEISDAGIATLISLGIIVDTAKG